MMKKAILLLSVASVLSGQAVAQSVLSTSGCTTETLTWTLGEVFTESVLRSNVVRFSQGFNQPIEFSTSGILSIKGDNLTFTAGPNPVADVLYLTVSGSGVTTWQLYDLQGRMLDSGRMLDGQQAVIGFADRKAGEYLLKMENETGRRSVKIIKK
ncbi:MULTISPECIES: T9SS type A sorting domain-containing protein [unclassified Barnesiella]|uniref:T9SS type A sorting domain-containing protein n=1 Tax=unclassified Barnesiella TaxID=2645177 RepID=UPI001FA6821C|nr:T9SS type A sorting domain-containing protein [Barnesiella sp. ET7]MCR8910388.1 T9SS type A sorting domain-containing protein [Barnesiella sp. ET7]HJB73926.1 T9SS type A sorting domain-containing protein [Candidatus Barnesiella merdigallinarum]